MRGIRTTMVLAAAAVSLIALQANCLAYPPQTTLDVSVSVQIPQMLQIGWAQDGSAIDMTGANAITPADMLKRVKSEINGGALALSANTNFELAVRASDGSFTGGEGSKPTSDLALSLDGSGSYVRLDGANEVVLLDNFSPEQGGQHSISYRIDLDPARDKPGTYATALTFTIKAEM